MATTDRGFAKMKLNDPERQRQIASQGGKRAHARGAAHEFTSEEAKAAGRKGGQATSRLRGEEFYHQIGRKGGQSKSKKSQEKIENLSEFLPESSIFFNSRD